MNSFDLLDSKRRDVLEKMSAIQSMRKGVLSEYHVKTKLKDGSVKLNGPYHVLSLKGAKNKTMGEKIPNEMLESVQVDVENYKLFRKLSDEYIAVCEQISKQSAHADLSEERSKKNGK
jgi:hypothetical protein